MSDIEAIARDVLQILEACIEGGHERSGLRRELDVLRARLDPDDEPKPRAGDPGLICFCCAGRGCFSLRGCGNCGRTALECPICNGDGEFPVGDSAPFGYRACDRCFGWGRDWIHGPVRTFAEMVDKRTPGGPRNGKGLDLSEEGQR